MDAKYVADYKDIIALCDKFNIKYPEWIRKSN